MRIRICQLITELQPAGAERCVYELATRLPTDRFAVEVVALRGGTVADELRRRGVAVHVLGVCCKADVTKWPKLLRIFRRGRFDLLHTHLFHADLVGRPAAAVAGLAHLVHTVHVAERRFRPWQYAWARVAARWSDRLVCVSAGVRDHHARLAHLPRARYTVIHNGVDAAAYSRDARRRSELRRQWGLADDDVLCAFVGRLDRQKGIDVVLDAFGIAALGCDRLHLVLAGAGPQRPMVDQWVSKSPLGRRVRAISFTADAPAVLSAADIFLQPSRWEGFCLAAAEAMAAGLPVVAGDVPGLNEVVAHEQTGLLCASEAVEEFAGALGALARDADRRARLGQAGRRRVSQRFSIEQFVGRHAELYESICTRGDEGSSGS